MLNIRLLRICVMMLLITICLSAAAHKSPRKEILAYMKLQGLTNPMVAKYIIDAQVAKGKYYICMLV